MMIIGKILKPKPRYFKIFLKLKSITSFCWIRYILITNKMMIDSEIIELKMSCPFIKLATLKTMQIKL